MRMSAGARGKRARSAAGVSPVRTAHAGRRRTRRRAPGRRRRRCRRAAPAGCARRRRRAPSAARRRGRGTAGPGRGTGENISRSMAQRNAASVLPLPVGERISVESPRAMAGQPSACGRGRPTERRDEPVADRRVEERERIGRRGHTRILPSARRRVIFGNRAAGVLSYLRKGRRRISAGGEAQKQSRRIVTCGGRPRRHVRRLAAHDPQETGSGPVSESGVAARTAQVDEFERVGRRGDTRIYRQAPPVGLRGVPVADSAIQENGVRPRFSGRKRGQAPLPGTPLPGRGDILSENGCATPDFADSRRQRARCDRAARGRRLRLRCHAAGPAAAAPAAGHRAAPDDCRGGAGERGGRRAGGSADPRAPAGQRETSCRDRPARRPDRRLPRADRGRQPPLSRRRLSSRRHAGIWSGGEGAGFGAGGRGFPAAGLLQRLLAGTETEAVGELHSPRWGERARVAAGIRRANGGAIMINAEAGEIEALQRQTSLESLIQDIVASHRPAGLHHTRSRRPPHRARRVAVRRCACRRRRQRIGQNSAGRCSSGSCASGGRAVLEFAGPVAFGEGRAGRPLRSGCGSTTSRRAERRMLVRLVVSLGGRARPLAAGARHGVAATGVQRAQREARARRGGAAPARPPERDGRAGLHGRARGAQPAECHRHERPAPSPRVPRVRLSGERRRGAPSWRSCSSVVEGETRRINDIVQQFLEFARPPKLAPREADLAGEVRDLVDVAPRDGRGARRLARPSSHAGGGYGGLRPGATAPGRRQPGAERHRGDPAGGRSPWPHAAARKGHAIEVQGHGQRNRRRRPAPGLRPLLHDQGSRHRRGARRDAADRRAPTAARSRSTRPRGAGPG